MIVREEENKIIFFEAPRKFTLFDALLTAYGLSIAVFCVYWVYDPPDVAPYWAFIFLGLLHIFFALNQLFSYFGATYTAVFDYQRRKLSFEKKGYFRNSAEVYDFDQIQCFHITQDFDPDSPEGWNVEMELKTGEQRAIPHSFSREQNSFEQVVQIANNYLTDGNHANGK